MYQVFVFGTLKEGFPNFNINKASRVKGAFLTKKRYPLYLIGDRYAPWLVLDEGNGHQIRGQVFEVDDVVLADMDELERINQEDGYRRVELTVISEESGEEMTVFVYGKPLEQLHDADIKLELKGEYKLEHARLYLSRTP